MSDDEALEHHPDGSGTQSCHADRNGCGHSRVNAERSDVSADHHKLAMSHVDDPHHAEDDREADGGEDQERDAVEILKTEAEEMREYFHGWAPTFGCVLAC